MTDTWRMRSGLRLKMQAAANGPVLEAAPPERATVLLTRHRPSVEPGSRVLTGTCIALPARSAASPLHSPVTGVVEKVTRKAIVVGRSGEDQWADLSPLSESSPGEEIRKRLFDCGVSALVPGGIPTGHGSSVAEGKKIEHLILVLSVTEPFLPDPIAIIHGAVELLAAGLRILARALAAPAVHVAGTREDISAVTAALPGARAWPEGVALHELPRRHPAMSELMLAHLALGRPRRLPRRAVEAGVVVVDAQTAFAAANAVLRGRAVVERAIALGGDGLRRSSCARYRVGTPLAEVVGPELREGAERCALVRGGLMSGQALPAEELAGPLTRRDVAIAALAPGSARRACAYPCVTCGLCVDVCPVGLAPYVFHRAAESELVDEAEAAGLETCVECGLCSYVCPSRLEILSEAKELKKMLEQDRETAR